MVGMRKPHRALKNAGIALMIQWVAVAWDGGHGVSLAKARSLSPTNPLPSITPQLADFPRGQEAHLTTYGREKTLRTLDPFLCLDNSIGGGVGIGPGSVMPNGWSLSIRYIIYKTPKDARGNYRREDCTRSRGPTPGSFSGAKIGDACASINDPPIGWYDLQFVRNRVSVYISAHCGPNQDREALGPEIRRGIEATANVIVRKIDRVVKSTGSVSLINLPPIRKPEAIRRSGPAYPDRVTKKAFAARAPAQPSPIDGASSITPSVEDFEPSLTDRFYFPRRDKIVRLMELNPNIQMVNTVGGGMGHGPGYSLIRYIIYKTPEDAKANWSSEDLTRPYKCVDGSFSGQLIGDACKHVSEPGLAEYDLGFMRGCVSVYIAWTAKPEQGASTSTSLRQAALEETAKVIVNRIDGVVKAKGTIDMSNLPPVHLRPG